jgi:hypothetical protein
MHYSLLRQTTRLMSRRSDLNYAAARCPLNAVCYVLPTPGPIAWHSGERRKNL